MRHTKQEMHALKHKSMYQDTLELLTGPRSNITNEKLGKIEKSEAFKYFKHELETALSDKPVNVELEDWVLMSTGTSVLIGVWFYDRADAKVPMQLEENLTCEVNTVKIRNGVATKFARVDSDLLEAWVMNQLQFIDNYYINK